MIWKGTNVENNTLININHKTTTRLGLGQPHYLNSNLIQVPGLNNTRLSQSFVN